MRASLRWLLPSDGEFQSGPDGQSYYLARQGQRVVLRGGDVKAPLANSRINWVCDSPPSQSPHMAPRPTLLENKNHNKKARINTKTVSRNVYPPPGKESTSISIAPSSDVRVRAPLTRIDSSEWHNLSQEIYPPAPRNNITNRLTSATATAPPPPKRKRNRVQRRERRAIERAERGEIFNHKWWAAQSPGALSSTTVPDPLTTIGLPPSEPISAMRPAVYSPVTEQGRPVANDNSSSLFGQELRESVPRQRRPDTHITVEAASLPEPAALHREELLPAREVPTDLTRPAQRLGRKRRRKRSSAIYRPAKRSPPRGRWCIL